jgi:hypothetical protein
MAAEVPFVAVKQLGKPAATETGLAQLYADADFRGQLKALADQRASPEKTAPITLEPHPPPIPLTHGFARQLAVTPRISNLPRQLSVDWHPLGWRSWNPDQSEGVQAGP